MQTITEHQCQGKVLSESTIYTLKEARECIKLSGYKKDNRKLLDDFLTESNESRSAAKANCEIHKNFKITSKTFRHNLLTILVNEQNVNLMIVQSISGHRDRRSLDYYVDTTRRQKRQAINNFMANYTPSIVA